MQVKFVGVGLRVNGICACGGRGSRWISGNSKTIHIARWLLLLLLLLLLVLLLVILVLLLLLLRNLGRYCRGHGAFVSFDPAMNCSLANQTINQSITPMAVFVFAFLTFNLIALQGAISEDIYFKYTGR